MRHTGGKEGDRDGKRELEGWREPNEAWERTRRAKGDEPQVQLGSRCARQTEVSRGADDVGANGAFTVAVHRLSVGMLTLAAASTNMPAHATHVWKEAAKTRMRQTELRPHACGSGTSSTTRLCP